jgi:dCMP deaminase
MFMEIAQVVAKRSTCSRLNVGAVLVRDNSIVSIGYNGTPAGEPHCAGNLCSGRWGCKETIHAEVNALNRCPVWNGDFDLYVTDSPCGDCLGHILADGRVKRVYFGTPYRKTEHLDNPNLGIAVYRVTPAGYIMNWITKDLV